jgi:DNA-binding transcriptional regulator YhcF (GntR family)
VFDFQTRSPGVGNFHEHLADDLIRGIAKGLRRSGERLPTEKELAESYRYSISVVRQAKATLKNLGLIKVVKRSQGTVVAPGAQQIAMRYLRDRDHAEAERRDALAVELAQPVGSYTRDDPPRDVIEITYDAAYSVRTPTGPELDAGTYAPHELVVDVALPDGAVRSYGFFRTTFKFAPLCRHHD